MPSLKMKTNSTMGRLSEKNGLHVCQKSSTITKNPLSSARIAQNVEEVETFFQSSLDASFYDEVFAQCVAGNKTNYDELSNAEKLLQNQQFNKTGSAAIDNLESTPSPCTTNVEAIFSSILDSLDFHNDEGSDNFYVPQLDSEDSDDSSRSSHEYQACSVSDFNISDMIFSAPPIESNLILDNKIYTASVPDYTCEESNLLSDLSEEYMVLPFLEDNTQRDPDGRTSGETIIDTDNSSLYMAIHQLRSCNKDADINTSNDPDYDCFDPQMYFRNLSDRMGMAPIAAPKEKQSTKQITLVLDLDETLVHSTLDYCEDADFTFPVFFNMKEHTVYVKKRPHLQVFLNRISEMFEIMVFTASQSIYAKQLLDILDPEGKLLSKRAYRESCIFSDGCYLKDLTVLGVDLAKVAIIDNSPQVFRLQVNNGIPIKSWFDDQSDCGLLSLLPFLETLADADDVRPIIARKFGNKE